MVAGVLNASGTKFILNLEILPPILYVNQKKSTAIYTIIKQQNIKTVKQKYLSFVENTESFFSAQTII